MRVHRILSVPLPYLPVPFLGVFLDCTFELHPCALASNLVKGRSWVDCRAPQSDWMCQGTAKTLRDKERIGFVHRMRTWQPSSDVLAS
jgi:hypothetical protein